MIAIARGSLSFYVYIGSSQQRCSVRNRVLRNFKKFIGKHLCRSLFFNKIAGLSPATILTKLQIVRQTKVQKRFMYGEKKQSMEQRETNSNASQAQQRLIRVKAIGCFCRGAPSLMFGRILNATLSEKACTTGATQKNLEFQSLDPHQTQNNKMKFWTDPMFLLP